MILKNINVETTGLLIEKIERCYTVLHGIPCLSRTQDVQNALKVFILEYDKAVEMLSAEIRCDDMATSRASLVVMQKNNVRTKQVFEQCHDALIQLENIAQQQVFSSRNRMQKKWLIMDGTVILFALLAFFGIRGIRRVISTQGITVTYYNGINFDQPIAKRLEQRIEKRYGNKSPVLFGPENNFSARWQGVLCVPDSDDYTFTAQSDDGVRVCIDDVLLINNWQHQGWDSNFVTQTTFLHKGEHALVVEHYDHRGGAGIHLTWSGGSIPVNSTISVPYLRKTAHAK